MSTAPATGRNGKPIVTTCKHGHTYTAETTLYRKNGSRNCLICKRMARQASTPPPEPVDLLQDRAPFVDPDCAVMLWAAYIVQAIKDFLQLPHQGKHWKSAAAVLAGENMLLAGGAIDTRGYELPARYARKEQV